MKTKKKQQQGDDPTVAKYRAELVKLYRACNDHVSELWSDAKLLYDNKRYARAYFLAVTAFEEFGKGQLVADYVNEVVSRREFEDAFHKHKMKLAWVRTLKPNFEQRGEMAELVSFDYDTEGVKELVEDRERSLYIYKGKKKDDFTPSVPDNESYKEKTLNILKTIMSAFSALNSREKGDDVIGLKALWAPVFEQVRMLK